MNLIKQKNLCIIFLLFVPFSILSQSKGDKDITIGLVRISGGKTILKNEYTEFNLRNFDRTPKYKEYLTQSYHGIPSNDSIRFYGQLNDNSVLYDLHKSGYITTDDYLKTITQFKIDTLNHSNIKLKRGLVIIVGFHKDRQFIIADSNHNEDFSDDVKYEFDINFRKNPNEDVIRNLPVSEYTFENCTKGVIQKQTRQFILYPNIYNDLSLNADPDKAYTSTLRLVDTYKGESEINNKNIDFRFDGLDNSFGLVYIKPRETSFSEDDFVFNDQFKHNFGDTVTISNSLYKIKCLDAGLTKLYLAFVGKRKDQFGNTINSYIKNITFTNLANKQLTTDELFKKKKYTLIDFWGTWCGPCLKMTPRLHALFIKSQKKLNILSFAFDRDITAVKKYVQKNGMDWMNSFIPMDNKKKKSIEQQLDIKNYPTFILVDSDGKILIRGSIETFDEIEKFLN